MHRLHCLLFLFFFTLSPGKSQASDGIDVSGLLYLSSGDSLPDYWQLKTFFSIPEHTDYEIVMDALYGPVIRAEASGGAAGLVRKLSVKPEKYPLLSWSWKVSNVFPSASIRDKAGDDCPARLFVSFGVDYIRGGVPRGNLCYVWASREAVGTIVTNPHLDDVATIVVASGDENAGLWQTFERNIEEDYFSVYGERPGLVRAITLMTDGDNTAGTVTAWYGPIFLKK